MRETRTAQTSIFDFYAEHKIGSDLKELSAILDRHPESLQIIRSDILNGSDAQNGRNGLSIESIFRCMLLKQRLNVSYQMLAFHLSDSQTFRTFARLGSEKAPCKTTLSTNIRLIQPTTLEKVFNGLAKKGLDAGALDLETVRIDSTVVRSNISAPSDSKLLDDGVRVLSRLLANSQKMTGLKIRFKDYRKSSRSLAFRIFNGKKAEKDRLYRDLLSLSEKVIDQAERGVLAVQENEYKGMYTEYWLAEIQHYIELMLQVIEQTQRRILYSESVPATEKIVSIFEEHTDIIVKGKRDVEYGHKINVASDKNGFLTHISIEKGNPSDAERFLPILDAHKVRFKRLPSAVVSDGCYASQANVEVARQQGIKRVVFNKKRGLGLRQMGVKQKTYDALKDFRAGVEGNISELKRAFGLGKAKLKGYDGFHSYVWASAIAYNLVRMARFESG